MRLPVLTRRGLLGLLGAAALDPERLLWVPGARLISIPARPKIVVGYRMLVNPLHGGVAQERWGLYDPRQHVFHYCETYYLNQRTPAPAAPHLPAYERGRLAALMGVSPADLVVEGDAGRLGEFQVLR